MFPWNRGAQAITPATRLNNSLTQRIQNRRVSLLLTALLLMAIQPAGQRVELPTTDQKKKVLIICIDGMRADAMEAATAPQLHQLVTDGTYDSNAQCQDLTFSGPNWSSILHGVHRDKHGVTSNGYLPNNLANWPDFFTYLERNNAAWNTYRILTWDAAHNNQPSGSDFKIYRDYSSNGDELATQDLEKIIRGTHQTYQADPDVVFIFYSDVDVAGHQYGFHPSVPQYLAEISDTDQKIGRVLNAIKGRPNYANENWLTIVTTDHGGSIDGSHHGNTPEKRRIPFIVSGQSASHTRTDRVAKNVDVARTVLAFMGVPVNPAWALDGHTYGLQLPGWLEPVPGNQLVKNGNFEFDRGFGGSLPDQYVTSWDDPGPDMATTIVYGAPEYPSASSPGPANRGATFCCGGNQAAATLTQTIDLSSRATLIDQGLPYHLSAWLGGYSSQDDNVKLIATFRGGNGGSLGTIQLGPVLASHRNNITGLLLRESRGGVPIGTRKVVLEMQFTRTGGSVNDGYADEISFTIKWHNGVVDTSN